MYQGYFCFGGTEIINNPRTVGYARTASQIEDRSVPPAPLGPSLLLAENLYTNPSFEASVGIVDLRTNYAPNPRAVSTGFPWVERHGGGGAATVAYKTTGGTPPAPGLTTFVEAERTADATTTSSWLRVSQFLADVVAAEGETWTLSAWVRSNVAGRVGVTLAFMNSTGGYALNEASQTVETTGNIWHRVSVTVTAAAGTERIRIEGSMSNSVTGDQVKATGFLLEKVGTEQPYFDPIHGLPAGVVDPDMFAIWEGAEHSSSSILGYDSVENMGRGVTNVSRFYRTADRPYHGNYAARVVLLSTSGAGIAPRAIPLVTGEKYTLIMRVRANSRDQAVVPRIQNTLAPPVVLPQGEWVEIRYTALAGSGTSGQTGILIEANASGRQIGDTIDIDASLIVAGEYSGDYFDGSSAEDTDNESYLWTGTADASTSQWIMLPAEPEVARYCNIDWFKRDECDTLNDALGEEAPYEAQYLEQSPWYSVTSPYGPGTNGSDKFLGAYGVEVSSLSDSPTRAAITEGITDGGVIGRSRRSVPTFRFVVMLTAVDEEGLEYGTVWLNSALSDAICSTHGPSCGSVDMSFLVDCPPIRPDSWTDEEYERRLDSMTRVYHDVKRIEGPIVTQEIRRPDQNLFGRIVEFTVAAGVPSLFGPASLSGVVPPEGERIVTDAVQNLIPYPSAEVASASQIRVSTNHSTNPSLETNATGWAPFTAQLTGSVTSGRITGELASDGVASFRTVFTASGADVNGAIGAEATVTIPAATADTRVSLSIWGAALLQSGTAVLDKIISYAMWYQGSTVLGVTDISSVPPSGGRMSIRNITPPVGATSVVIRTYMYITSYQSGAVVRFYADSVGVITET